MRVLRAKGATPVDLNEFDYQQRIAGEEWKVLLTEFKADLNAYLVSPGDGKQPGRAGGRFTLSFML